LRFLKPPLRRRLHRIAVGELETVTNVAAATVSGSPPIMMPLSLPPPLPSSVTRVGWWAVRLKLCLELDLNETMMRMKVVTLMLCAIVLLLNVFVVRKILGPTSKNPLAYKWYNANEEILGKNLESKRFGGTGGDPFSMRWEDATNPSPMAKQRARICANAETLEETNANLDEIVAFVKELQLLTPYQAT
ncbi:hypothetical protein M8C21_003707, partial [Ambrosia artemisiifolia]